MNVSVVIDASVLVSWMVFNDANHDASYSWIKRYRAMRGLLVAPSFALIEVAAAIARQTRQPALAKAAMKDLYSVSTLRIVHLDSILVRSAVEIASDLQLRAGDATYVAVAYKLNIPLVSWDKEQLQRGRAFLTTFTPGTYPFELPT